MVHVLRFRIKHETSHPCCFWGNLHTFDLQDMQIISDLITKRVLSNSSTAFLAIKSSNMKLTSFQILLSLKPVEMHQLRFHSFYL